jgi:hypothetical protein
LLVALAAVLLIALQGARQASAVKSHAAKTSPAWVNTALNRLDAMKVKPAASMSGYSRDQFGPAWADANHNGCDTRNDILRRDLKDETFKDAKHCVVLTGTLRDPYTGQTIHFVRGIKTSSAVQIDHVVALADAWRTGAASWKPPRRLAYANDPVVLLAVDGPQNEAKGDDDASEWQPPSPYKCRYVAKQVAVNTKYTMWVTPAEHDAMQARLTSCSDG